jgi:hypothetical protein
LTLDPDAKMRADVETKLTKGLPAEPRERIAEEGPPPTLPGQP